MNNNSVPCTVCLCLQCILKIFSITSYSGHWLVCWSRCLLVQVWPLRLDPGRKYWTLQEACFVKIKTWSHPQVNRPLHNKYMDTNSNTPYCLMWLILHTKTTEINIREFCISTVFETLCCCKVRVYSIFTCWPFQRHIWEWKKKTYEQIHGDPLEEYTLYVQKHRDTWPLRQLGF